MKICNLNIKVVLSLAIMLLITIMYDVAYGQGTAKRYLSDLSFEEINTRIQNKINSFEKAESLVSINQLLLSDFPEDQMNTLKVYKLQALVEAELYDEALQLSKELLAPIDVSPKLEVLVLLERTLLYELLDNMPESKKDLNRIQRLYETELEKKDESYGRFLFRISSWYRVNDRRQESIEWAKKAVDHGITNNFPNVSATGFLLMGLNTDRDSYLKRRAFFQKGLRLWKDDNRKIGAVNMYNLLSSSYFDEGMYSMAKIYNDSSLYLIDQFKTNYSRPRIYQQRSLITESLNQPDSALYYERRYAEGQISALKRSRNIKFRELEFELKKEKTILENIKLETQLAEADRKESYFTIVLIAGAFFFLCLGLLIITLASRNKRIKDQNIEIKETNLDLSNNIEEKEFLLQEVNHRVKNNLAFIQSLIAFQKDEAISAETSLNLESLNSRIHAIAVLHDQFVSAKNSISKKEIAIAPYIENIANAHVMAYPNKVRFLQNMNDIKVNLETAVPIGILVNELISNSIKHASPKGPLLHIDLKMMEDDGRLHLDYGDNGNGFEIETDKDSLGLYIIKTMVLQLRGTKKRVGSNYHITLQRR